MGAGAVDAIMGAGAALLPIFKNFMDTGVLRIGDTPMPFGVYSKDSRKSLYGAFTQFLDNTGRGRYTTRMAQKLWDTHKQLAKRIALAANQSPENAERASEGTSLESFAAFLLMQQTSMQQLPQKFGEFMQRAGVRSAQLGNAPKIAADNRRMGSLANTLFDFVSDFKQADHFQGMMPGEIVDFLSERRGQGGFRDITQDRRYLASNGELSALGKVAVKDRARQLLKVGSDFRYLLGGTIPEAMQSAHAIFGRDPVQALGVHNASRMLSRMEATLETTGVSPDEARGLLQYVAQSTAGENVHPSKLLALTENGLRLMAGSREGRWEGVDPAQFNADVFRAVMDSDKTDVSKALKTGYGALATHRGTQAADQIMDQILSEQGMSGDAQTADQVIENINQYLSSTEQVGSDNWRMYFKSKPAQEFDMSGRGIPYTMRRKLQHLSGMRESVLARSRFSPREVDEIKLRHGQLNADSVRAYLTSLGSMDSQQVENAVQDVSSRWQRAARKEGYQSPASLDRMTSAAAQFPDQQREIKNRQRAARALALRGRTSGLIGVGKTLLTEQAPTWNTLFKGFAGDKDITEDDLQKMFHEQTPAVLAEIRGMQTPPTAFSKLRGAASTFGIKGWDL